MNNSTSKEIYRVKEDLLLKNFLDKSRRDKAKVLRLQQVKDYDEWMQESLSSASIRRKTPSSNSNNVAFVPSSLIQDAIKEGNKHEVLDLLSKGVSINFNDVQGEGMTLLHQACVYDDYIIAQALIKQGASLDIQDDYGCTPLHICCMWDSLKCAQLLVSNNASVNILDIDGNFAIDLAPDNSHLKAMMRKHMQQKLKIDESQLQSLRNRPQKQILQDIRQLLEEGASVDQASAAGVSLLHVAVTNGYVSAARMLLENSANVNAADAQLWTPLHCAAKYGQVKMARLLLSHYANPHSRTTSGFTPRELAKDSEIIEMLANAEDTFLDLDNQRTPAKPKRFSASLLDQCDDDGDISRVPSRIIFSTKTSKRDVFKEKEIINKLGEELKQELKSEIQFHPPSLSPNILSIPTWQQLMPPPVPPRDDPPELRSPLHTSSKGRRYFPTNVACDDITIKAVVTIQRAFRKYRSRIQSHSLSAALKTLEDYGNSFFEEMVFQNAEDIARESDRQRSRKSHQRNSWSNDLRRSVRSSVTDRPLSTGHLYMTHRPHDTAVWLPQNPPHGGYHSSSVTSDLISQHAVPGEYWTAGPRHGGSRRKSTKQLSGSTDSGVSLSSAHKDHIELTKTVKQSLIISESPDYKPPSAILRKASLPPMSRPITHPTYRMATLTPTVASLINTAATASEKSAPASNTLNGKGPVEPANPESENVYLIPDQPEPRRFRSHTTREHRYGSLMSNRGTILRDARFQALGNSEQSTANRHSWNGEQNEGVTDFSKPPRPSNHRASPIFTEKKLLADGVASVPHSPVPSVSANNSMRRGSKQAAGGPPPPPRRAPTTKLSVSNDHSSRSSRSNSFSTFQSPVTESKGSFRHSTPLSSVGVNNLGGSHENSTDDELPDVPPALPLYNPPALAQKQSSPRGTPAQGDFPAPPPPDMLLYNTLKNMNSQERNQSFQEGRFNFPPPPPTL